LGTSAGQGTHEVRCVRSGQGGPEKSGCGRTGSGTTRYGWSGRLGWTWIVTGRQVGLSWYGESVSLASRRGVGWTLTRRGWA